MAQGLAGPIQPPRYQGYVEDIAESGHQLLGLINKILDFSKATSGDLPIRHSAVDLEAVVASSCLAIAHAASQSDTPINLERRTPHWPKLEADEARLKEILANLLSNAVKASPKGKPVRLRVVEAGRWVWLIIADHGAGMALGEVESLMAAPYGAPTAEAPATTGLGLGLAMARTLLDLHGGKLKVRSRLGRGTVAAAVLPLQAASARPPMPVGLDEPGRVIPFR